MSRGAHLPRGTAGDGPFELVITPESAGWGFSGLRDLAVWPGGAHVFHRFDSQMTEEALQRIDHFLKAVAEQARTGRPAQVVSSR